MRSFRQHSFAVERQMFCSLQIKTTKHSRKTCIKWHENGWKKERINNTETTKNRIDSLKLISQEKDAKVAAITCNDGSLRMRFSDYALFIYININVRAMLPFEATIFVFNSCLNIEISAATVLLECMCPMIWRMGLNKLINWKVCKFCIYFIFRWFFSIA